MITAAALILFFVWAGWYNRRQARRAAAAQVAQEVIQEDVLCVAPAQPVSRNKTGLAWVQDELIDIDAEQEEDL